VSSRRGPLDAHWSYRAQLAHPTDTSPRSLCSPLLAIGGKPGAPTPAQHERVQDETSKRFDRDQIRSREPGYGTHVAPNTDGTRWRCAPGPCRHIRAPWHCGFRSAPRRETGTGEGTAIASPRRDFGLAAVALRRAQQQRLRVGSAPVPAEHAPEGMSNTVERIRDAARCRGRFKRADVSHAPPGTAPGDPRTRRRTRECRAVTRAREASGSDTRRRRRALSSPERAR
jgi:hypothetical protein